MCELHVTGWERCRVSGIQHLIGLVFNKPHIGAGSKPSSVGELDALKVDIVDWVRRVATATNERFQHGCND